MKTCSLKNGKTLAIRPALREDAAAIITYMKRVGGESGNLSYGLDEFPYTLEQEEAILDRIAGEDTSLMLTGWVEDALVTLANYGGSAKPRLRHNIGVGLTVRRDHWRMGIGKIMLETLIECAKETGIVKNIQLEVRADNAGAIRLYERLGFQHAGKRSREMLVDGQYFDSLCMELLLE